MFKRIGILFLFCMLGFQQIVYANKLLIAADSNDKIRLRYGFSYHILDLQWKGVFDDLLSSQFSIKTPYLALGSLKLNGYADDFLKINHTQAMTRFSEWRSVAFQSSFFSEAYYDMFFCLFSRIHLYRKADGTVLFSARILESSGNKTSFNFSTGSGIHKPGFFETASYFNLRKQVYTETIFNVWASAFFASPKFKIQLIAALEPSLQVNKGLLLRFSFNTRFSGLSFVLSLFDDAFLNLQGEKTVYPVDMRFRVFATSFGGFVSQNYMFRYSCKSLSPLTVLNAETRLEFALVNTIKTENWTFLTSFKEVAVLLENSHKHFDWEIKQGIVYAINDSSMKIDAVILNNFEMFPNLLLQFVLERQLLRINLGLKDKTLKTLYYSIQFQSFTLTWNSRFQERGLHTLSLSF